MQIEGLDYNTQREKLLLPEYGREIQKMVDHALTIKDKKERQKCAETIIDIMDKMFPYSQNEENHMQKLWSQLALISNFKLEIDYPYDVAQALKISSKPQPMQYPMSHIPVRHYGKMLFEVFEQLENMEPSEERDALIKATANQMKRNLAQWGHGSLDDEKIASDLAYFTHGKVQIDLQTFKFEKIEVKEASKKVKRK